MPALTVMRFPNDHTTGMKNGFPTPQFMVADNDYAVGRLVEAVSSSAYWKDTAIFIVEDDAQSGPDHVDSHRSVGLDQRLQPAGGTHSQISQHRQHDSHHRAAAGYRADESA
jgi:hypothetical protein